MSTAEQIKAAATASLAAAKPVTVAPTDNQLAEQLAAANQRIAELQEKLTPQVIVNETRLYHSSLPFIRVPYQRVPGHAEFVQFVGGRLETSDPIVIATMEAMIAAGGSGFSHAPVQPGADVAEMQADLMHLAQIAHGKMVAAGEKTA